MQQPKQLIDFFFPCEEVDTAGTTTENKAIKSKHVFANIGKPENTPTIVKRKVTPK